MNVSIRKSSIENIFIMRSKVESGSQKEQVEIVVRSSSVSLLYQLILWLVFERIVNIGSKVRSSCQKEEVEIVVRGASQYGCKYQKEQLERIVSRYKWQLGAVVSVWVII